MVSHRSGAIARTACDSLYQQNFQPTTEVPLTATTYVYIEPFLDLFNRELDLLAFSNSMTHIVPLRVPSVCQNSWGRCDERQCAVDFFLHPFAMKRPQPPFIWCFGRPAKISMCKYFVSKAILIKKTCISPYTHLDIFSTVLTYVRIYVLSESTRNRCYIRA